jgi:hypothetical protein
MGSVLFLPFVMVMAGLNGGAAADLARWRVEQHVGREMDVALWGKAGYRGADLLRARDSEISATRKATCPRKWVTLSHCSNVTPIQPENVTGTGRDGASLPVFRIPSDTPILICNDMPNIDILSFPLMCVIRNVTNHREQLFHAPDEGGSLRLPLSPNQA